MSTCIFNIPLLNNKVRHRVFYALLMPTVSQTRNPNILSNHIRVCSMFISTIDNYPTYILI